MLYEADDTWYKFYVPITPVSLRRARRELYSEKLVRRGGETRYFPLTVETQCRFELLEIEDRDNIESEMTI